MSRKRGGLETTSAKKACFLEKMEHENNGLRENPGPRDQEGSGLPAFVPERERRELPDLGPDVDIEALKAELAHLRQQVRQREQPRERVIAVDRQHGFGSLSPAIFDTKNAQASQPSAIRWQSN